MIISEEQLFLNQQLDTKKEVLTFITEKAAEMGITNNQTQLNEDLWAREKEYATAVQPLIAIPHAKTTAITEAKLLFIRLVTPIDWGSVEGFQVQAIFSILVPAGEASQQHLKILSGVAVSLLEDTFQKQILTIKTEYELMEYLKETLEGELI
ncbi:PTS sugar transporter subunit IIA [Listeria grandensis]|uniref:PTS sugar transporter subunit IIA n=1 Tax=Listeria grandensis TaxID=1494963 RepID=A0A7X0Y3T2_9LIST|nr:PTS sugar transporter subunit IIA [Listeria grandensis]MBC1474040.1 PTS sugar transporter subunit IIA [Listeria grandensis]MBC1936358.1 PTS sugar transporter subunit IIA [Listeria grandensis]